MAGCLGKALSTAPVASVPSAARCSSSLQLPSILQSRPVGKPWYICQPQPQELELAEQRFASIAEEQTVRNRLEQLFQSQTLGLRSLVALRSRNSNDADALSSLERREPAQTLSLAVQTNVPPRPALCSRQTKGTGGNNQKHPDFYANLGTAIRTLREEIPLLFQRDLTYSIYREDIVFKDPRLTFKGLRNYKLIFWSLRFHGRIFFSSLYVDVSRIWQPDEQTIRMRWTVLGVPRVPWEAEGIFDGVSQFKLDKEGKIYEHSIDNVILRDPPMLRSPLFAGLNLIPLQQQQPAPCPGAFCKGLPEGRHQSAFLYYLVHFSWVRMYAALLGTVQLLQFS